MKIILWATLTANGNYARSSKEHPPKQEALDNFAGHVKEVGNFIVGRKTFESFRNSGGGNAFSGIDIVVLSTSTIEISGVTLVHSPKEALEYLEQKGHKTALLAGGESLHNAFMAEKLVDELYFTIVPTLEDRGLSVVLEQGQYAEVHLLEVKQLGNGIVQLHYSFTK